MNCPSRTEQDPIHPDWNQNPPAFSPDLTTHEDFNGRVNSRQLREASRLASLGLGTGADDRPEKGLDIPPSSRTLPHLAEAKIPRGYYEEFCSARRNMNILFKTWYHRGFLWGVPAILMAMLSAYYMAVIISSFERRPKSPKSLLSKRESVPCKTGGEKPDYNVGLHVGALAIILFVSFVACVFPMLAVRFPKLRIPRTFHFVVRHFGTGVLIATAFVHLLPTAFISLGNPCLSQFWTEDYPAMPGAISLAAVFLVTVIEMVFSPARHICGGNSKVTELICNQESQSVTRDQSRMDESTEVPDRSRDHDHLEQGSQVHRSMSITRAAPNNDKLKGIQADEHAVSANNGSETEDEFIPITLSPEQRMQKAFMQCILLEVGILFHSVFIGMALSVSVGNDFVVLLIAITFHQSFEGLALGARIASLPWAPNALQPWLMALAYGCTTPIGQAIGLATHTLYEPDSEVGLIMVGTMNAISSGLLVYASLVELLAEDFLSDESWRVLKGKWRVLASILVFLGASGMSLVGAWA